MTSRTINLLVTVAALATSWVQGQRLTIPEAVSRGGVSSGGTIPSGPDPTINHMLEKTDLVVVGTLGEPHSYLSEDQLDVNTDFPVKDATVLYYKYPPSKSQSTDNKPQQVLTVTQLGGTIEIDGKKFTQEEKALPALQPGTKGLFLLQLRGDKYWIAGPSKALPFYGAFSITSESKLIPLMASPDFGKDYRNVKVSEGLGRMMKILHSQTQPKQDSTTPNPATN
jgi:hypothetical protein